MIWVSEYLRIRHCRFGNRQGHWRTLPAPLRRKRLLRRASHDGRLDVSLSLTGANRIRSENHD